MSGKDAPRKSSAPSLTATSFLQDDIQPGLSIQSSPKRPHSSTQEALSEQQQHKATHVSQHPEGTFPSAESDGTQLSPRNSASPAIEIQPDMQNPQSCQTGLQPEASTARGAEASVFAGLEGFTLDNSSESQPVVPAAPAYTDPDDGMENMILDLGRVDPQFQNGAEGEWQFDNIGVPDAAQNPYSAMSLDFMEYSGPSAARSAPQLGMQVTLQGRAANPASTASGSGSSSAPPSVPALSFQRQDSKKRTASKMSTKSEDMQQHDAVPDTQVSSPTAWHQTDDPMQMRTSLTKIEPASSSAINDALNQNGQARSVPPTPSHAARMRSPGSSTSSAPSKGKVPTAICSVCGKSISTNGANFRRHEKACLRQRANRASGSRPPASPALVTPPMTPGSNPVFPAAESPSMPMRSPDPRPSDHSQSPYEIHTSPGHAQSTLERRDSGLLQVVRRLEASISTLDVNARICLRDALISLSNKASNPHIPPTPEQEAMNRAAEYLVLRMLFLSGQQVMHTAPGTAGPYSEGQTEHHDGEVLQNVGFAPNMGGAARQQRDIHGSSGEMEHSSILPKANGEDTDDGTIAASTGASLGSAIKSEKSQIRDLSTVGKREDESGS